MARLLLIFLSVLSFQVSAYDVQKSYLLFEDRLKRDEMLHGYEHDFLLDARAAVDPKLLTISKDVTDVVKISDQTAAYNAAAALAHKYDNTEHPARVALDVGVPIFSFTINKWKIRPNIRLHGDGGVNVAVKSETLTPQRVLGLVGTQIPENIKNAILAQTYAPGDLIVNDAVCTAAGVPTGAMCNAVKAEYSKYVYPTDTTLPLVFAFAKVDYRAGLFFDFDKEERWFGSFNLYGLSRQDYAITLTADSMKNGAKIPNPLDNLNSQYFLMSDIKFGHRFRRYSVWGSLEEVTLRTLNDSKKSSKGDLILPPTPLFRAHADAKYQMGCISLTPFIGLHLRNAYTFSQGLYSGGDLGMFFWHDRIGSQLRGMVDSQYFTISPRFKLWFMELEYAFKQPLINSEGGMTLPSFHTLDFRLSF